MSADHSIISGTVFEHAAEPAYVMDPEHSRILAANDAGCELLGYTREELLADADLSHPPVRARGAQ